MADTQYACGLTRGELIPKLAEFYVEFNMVHPFREGNGRVLRILFEHLVVNCGFQFSLAPIDQAAWTAANIASVVGDYVPMTRIFELWVGSPLAGE